MPHSAISGSPRVCHSPELLAAYHGLPRLRVPRHPPHAFSRLTTKSPAKQNYAHCFKTSDVFLRKSHLSKDSSIPRSTIHPLSNSDDPHGVSQGVNNREWNGQNVSKRSDYEMLSLAAREGVSYSRSVKEVIQPQVPLRLPCYDFAPVTALAFGRLAPCGFRHGLRALTASMA